MMIYRGLVAATMWGWGLGGGGGGPAQPDMANASIFTTLHRVRSWSLAHLCEDANMILIVITAHAIW